MTSRHRVPPARQTLRRIADDASLLDERAFIARCEAIDRLELALLEPSDDADEAVAVRTRLEQVDAALFERLRREIRSGRLRGAALLRCIRTFVPEMHSVDGRYDHLDTFMTGLLLDRPLPTETQSREDEMVFYQRTPSRVVLQMIARGQWTAGDVFYDLGSGLGEVTVLTNLLTEATTKGVEYEPSYCEYAEEIVRDLRLTNIEFLNADARQTNFSDGTVFFLYTPFVGSMLRDVLERLRLSTAARRIRIFTYGPCTPEVAAQEWLTFWSAEARPPLSYPHASGETHANTKAEALPPHSKVPLRNDRLAEFVKA